MTKKHLSLMLTLLAAGCGGMEQNNPQLEGNKADDTLSNYSSLSFSCTRQYGISGSITEDASTFSDPFASKISVDASESRVDVQGDLVRLFVPTVDGQPDDDGLYVQLAEYDLDSDPLMVLFARRPGESWRMVQVPIDMSISRKCDPTEERADDAPACVKAAGGYYQSLPLKDNLEIFYWARVTRNFQPDMEVPKDPSSSFNPNYTIRSLMSHGEEDTGKDGLLFSALPRKLEGLYNDAGAEESVYKLLVYESAIFIPFEKIPALSDLADGPVEWAVMGINRWDYWGTLAGSFDYDLYVECPKCQSLVTDENDTSNRCQLPELI